MDREQRRRQRLERQQECGHQDQRTGARLREAKYNTGKSKWTSKEDDCNPGHGGTWVPREGPASCNSGLQ